MNRPTPSDNGGQEQAGKGGVVTTDRLTLRLGEFRAELTEAAAGEQRDLSGMARVLLQRGLRCRTENHVAVARSGYLRLLELAEEHGMALEDVVRDALRYAVQHEKQWIKGGTR
jgi:hypothetical protein